MGGDGVKKGSLESGVATDPSIHAVKSENYNSSSKHQGGVKDRRRR